MKETPKYIPRAYVNMLEYCSCTGRGRKFIVFSERVWEAETVQPRQEETLITVHCESCGWEYLRSVVPCRVSEVETLVGMRSGQSISLEQLERALDEFLRRREAR